ncbi:hypothetical protein [Bosea sp. (in: a-proteobacteria)]|uniref:hypothetical protein n=1 Tax=Bosea sp. (in: a-proteobacteria) TaxID=1871050 RepID=UPI0025BCBE86|nr:hypothetical protein [Bosea sp. (in: a-proteobacteria)]MBR3190452.1 hypothetical protein [Bosea sp. (in: a-proteobacteria)]
MKTYDDGFDLNPRLAMAVGCVVIQWARVEAVMQRLCVGILGSSGPIGYALTANLGNRSISEFLGVVAQGTVPQSNDDHFPKELETLVAEFDRLLGLRNRLAHNTWPRSNDEERVVALVARFKGKIRLLEEIWSFEQIEAIIDEVVELRDALEIFGERYGFFDGFKRWADEQDERGVRPEPVPVVDTKRSARMQSYLDSIWEEPSAGEREKPKSGN